MQTVISADGTRLAFWRQGSGPPLLLVHGGVCDHLAWYFVTPHLADKFTVFSYDRRGRGESGDTLPYSVERELEDVGAMLAMIGEPAHLVGHSAGGILSLETAQRSGDLLLPGNLLSLMLYEPAYVVEGAGIRPQPGTLEKMRALLAEGNREEVIRMAMRETLELPESEIAAMGAGPGWEHLLKVAHTIPYDLEVWKQPLDAEKAGKMETRTLLLMGSKSPEWLQMGTRTVLAALPHARLEVLEGEEHLAPITAPELFAKAVANFAVEPDSSASAVLST